MGPPRAAAGLLLRTASSTTHIANDARTCVCIARQVTSLRSKSNPSTFASPSNQRFISNAAARTSQQAVAKKEEPEDEPEQQPPPSQPQPQPRQQDRSRIARDFLGGPSQAPNRRPQNPLRDGNDLDLDLSLSPTPSTTRQQPKPTHSTNDLSADVSQRFSFLRQPHSAQPPNTTATTPKTNPYGGPEAHQSSFDTLISAFSKHSPASRKTNNRADASRMLAPRPPSSSANDPLGATLSLVHDYAEPDLSAPAFRLGPRLPRTVAVNQRRGVDLTRALAMLGSRLSANDVRGEFFRQKFHERPGMKKKRLASQRWRRRFRDNMNEIIRRVKDIRRQGW